MRSLIRSAFLLSLAAAPLAAANSTEPGTPPAANYTDESAAAKTTARPLNLEEQAVLRVHVDELEATLTGMRGELARLREEQDARARVIGDPNDHPLWP
jgi:TolA-binding protein